MEFNSPFGGSKWWRWPEDARLEAGQRFGGVGPRRSCAFGSGSSAAERGLIVVTLIGASAECCASALLVILLYFDRLPECGC